jgi:hypothetical protein
VPAIHTFERNYKNKEGKYMVRNVFQAVWEEVFQYGKYGGPNCRGGEWVDDQNASNGLTWNERVPPIDGLDSLFRDHDKTYGWAEKMLEKGEITPSQEQLMKIQADIQLLAGLVQYNTSTDPTCKDPMTAQRYQFLAMTAFGPIRGR